METRNIKHGKFFTTRGVISAKNRKNARNLVCVEEEKSRFFFLLHEILRYLHLTILDFLILYAQCAKN